MIALLFRQLWRRPLRTGLTLAGLAVAMALLVSIVAFGDGYRRALRRELDSAGVQLMLVPLGCPYDAAARVLKNNSLETSLPASALAFARSDPAVAVAAPLLLAALPRRSVKRTDLWVGLDESALALRPWWRTVAGRAWFGRSNEVILGADAAALEMRVVGDRLYSPETGREFHVAGILARSGTSDDSAFFVPLATAQDMFAQAGRLTAVALRLKDPALLREAVPRLQKVPGAQVVTMAEMMGTFLNLVGAVRTLVLAVAAIAIAVSALTIFNTLLASVLERTRELALLRALGASRARLFALLLGESVLLTLCGVALGLALAALVAPRVELFARDWIPFTPGGSMLFFSASALAGCAGLALGVSLLAALYPAWRASRLPPALAVKPA